MNIKLNEFKDLKINSFKILFDCVAQEAIDGASGDNQIYNRP